MPDTLSPQEIRTIRADLGLTLKAAADRAGVHIRTWQHWEQEQGPSCRTPRGTAVVVLRMLQREAARLRRVAR